ncbi:hypothetical protein K458DRAFT_414969 [Lentithecium fluviatile CBS 122367]|uniref:Cell wall protein SED1 n=1 Tax=Lentithecium fluviatile CBS 122367 TaxID=1168545 RepID=A0A6G1JBV2_9PLEO|nr:hypothetical protein K458DRAFT_414969 [Lentithecium fluviatile CBS 122367]
MKSFIAVAAFVAAANAYAYNTTTPVVPPVYETTTVSDYTTVCPGPTEIPVGPSSTITVTEATTLTITDCPCTITYPVVPTTAPEVPTTYPVIPSSVAPVYPTANGTVPAPVYPTGTSVPTTTGAPAPTEFPGAAGKAGLSLLAVAGALVAYL